MVAVHESQRIVDPLFHSGNGGSIPTSPLQFRIEPISRNHFKQLNKLWHSRLPICQNCWEGFCFGATHEHIYYAVAWWSRPVARMFNNRGFLELRRFAIAPDAPQNTATRMIRIMTIIIKREHPEINKLISYQDVDAHTGTIYKASGWTLANYQKWTGVGWKNRKDFNRINQSTSDKIRWEKNINSTL